jgi:hypothetical protein
MICIVGSANRRGMDAPRANQREGWDTAGAFGDDKSQAFGNWLTTYHPLLSRAAMVSAHEDQMIDTQMRICFGKRNVPARERFTHTMWSHRYHDFHDLSKADRMGGTFPRSSR